MRKLSLEHSGERPISSIRNQLANVKKISFDPFLTSHTKVNFAGTLDINTEDKTIKILGDTVGEYFCDLELGKDFLSRR